MPKRAAALDHVPRRQANATHESAHVIRVIEHHALASETVDIRRLELRPIVVDPEIQWRLIIRNDEQNIRPRGIRLTGVCGPGTEVEGYNQRECKYRKPHEPLDCLRWRHVLDFDAEVCMIFERSQA